MRSWRISIFAVLLVGTVVARVWADPIETKAMTFNIRLGVAKDGDNHWDKRRDLVSSMIERHAPDFCGLQEAWKFQLDFLLQNNPVYGFVGRSRQVDEEQGEWCPLLYRRDRWKVLESGTFWLSDKPEEAGSTSWGNGVPRICTWARFQEREGDFVVDVYNTHFDHKSQPSRLESARLMTKRIAQRSGGGRFLVLGDFNAAEDNPAMEHFRSNAKVPMEDTFRVAHPEAKNSGTFGAWQGKTGGAKIDGVFFPRGLGEVKRADILDDNVDGRYPSDHFPVDAVIAWHPLPDLEFEARGAYRRKIADLSAELALTPGDAGLSQERGVYRFFDTEIVGSIADFDVYLKQVPEREPHHWQRGLAYYYAGEFAKGARQFETHHRVNPDDVENSAWHVACLVRAGESTLEAAAKKIIPTRGDRRVPMMEIHRLYAGQGSVDEVLKACAEDRNALCFAHLYLGLWFEIQEEMDKAREHIVKSAFEYRMPHYMGTVSVVHARLRGWYP